MFERLGIMTLSSILKKNSHEVNLILTEELDEEEIIENVKNFKPHVLAYSIMTGEHTYHIDLNRMVRSHYNNALSVFGGPHPTYTPEMVNNEYVDAVCRGEGEIYFLQLIEKLEKGEDFYDIQNFWFKKKDGSIVKNKMGSLVENLDEPPAPDRELMYAADKLSRARGTKLFMSSRGCPYKCTFCAIVATFKRTVRFRSPETVFEEIQEVNKKYSIEGNAKSTFAYEIIDSTPAFECSKSSVVSRSVSRAIIKKLNSKPQFVHKTGTGDMNLLGNKMNIPVLTYGPGNPHLSHTSNEHIMIDEFLTSIDIYQNSIENVFNLIQRI